MFTETGQEFQNSNELLINDVDMCTSSINAINKVQINETQKAGMNISVFCK